MQKRIRITLLITLLIVSLLALPSGFAATPSGGTLDSSSGPVTWTGGPFPVSFPLTGICTSSSDPTCDHFELTVNLPAGAGIHVAIGTDNPASDDFDLYVFGGDGVTVMASSATAGGNEQVFFKHNLADYGAGPYTVSVLPFDVDPAATYTGVARTGSRGFEEGDLLECTQATPTAFAIPGEPVIKLRALVLLDGGLTLAEGQAAFNIADDSYDELFVDLIPRFRTVDFTGSDAAALIQQAKDLYGGGRPRRASLWSDVVYVLTAKDIELNGDPAVAGLADCIGGVEFDGNAFAVGEYVADEGFEIGPIQFFRNLTAKIAAHEIGHLMGAHHHYANCVEGVGLDFDPCTLMINDVGLASQNFSITNSLVVRGHAEAFLPQP